MKSKLKVVKLEGNPEWWCIEDPNGRILAGTFRSYFEANQWLKENSSGL